MQTIHALLLTSVLSTVCLNAQVPASSATDGAALRADEIAAQWQKKPALPPGVRTRGMNPPAFRTRGAPLSQTAVEANADALKNLRNRGMKILQGAEAAAAQAAQDQAAAPAAAPAPPPPAFVEVPVVPEQQIAFRLRFKLDSTDLADTESAALIDRIASAMRALPDAVFLLEGHTCDLGEAPHNQRLSEARALRVRTLLGDQGIPSSRLLSVGQGEAQSEVPNISEENRALNRRVVIGPIELPK